MKKIFITLLMFFSFLCLFACVGLKISADEIENEPITSEIEEIEEEEIQEGEKFDVYEAFDDFCRKWLPMISSILSTVGSYLAMMLLSWSKIKKLERTIGEMRDTNNDDYKSKVKELEQEKRDLLETSKELIATGKGVITHSRDLLQSYDVLIEFIKKQSKDFEQLKELFGLMVASTPELQNNGYAKKFLELLDGSESGSNENKEEV